MDPVFPGAHKDSLHQMSTNTHGHLFTILRRIHINSIVRSSAQVHWGLTPPQQPGSYQGGEMVMKSVFWWRKPGLLSFISTIEKGISSQRNGVFNPHDKHYVCKFKAEACDPA